MDFNDLKIRTEIAALRVREYMFFAGRGGKGIGEWQECDVYYDRICSYQGFFSDRKSNV